MPDKKLEVWTIGHSTRPIGEFVAALNSFRIEMLVDVRSFPGSRRYPQFGQAKLSASLADLSIGYTHLPALGGRRTARPDSLNVADRKSTRLNSSHLGISYAVFCLKKKKSTS